MTRTFTVAVPGHIRAREYYSGEKTVDAMPDHQVRISVVADDDVSDEQVAQALDMVRDVIVTPQWYRHAHVGVDYY